MEGPAIGRMLGAFLYILALAGLGLISGLSLQAFQHICNRAIVLGDAGIAEALQNRAAAATVWSDYVRWRKAREGTSRERSVTIALAWSKGLSENLCEVRGVARHGALSPPAW